MKKVLIIIVAVLLVYHFSLDKKEEGFTKYTHRFSNHPLKEFSDSYNYVNKIY